MGFLNPTTDFRWIVPSETDANSPLSEELMSQVRENLESNTMNRIYSGYRAKVVTRDSDTQLTIEKVDNGDQDWPTNVAAGLIVTFSSGAALGQNTYITANTALYDTPATATITTSGVFPGTLLAGDEFLMMYSQTGYAHTHNGVDSAPVGVDAEVGAIPGVSVPDSDPIKTFGPPGGGYDIDTYPTPLSLNKAMKAIYFEGSARLNIAGNKWHDRTGEIIIYLYAQAADSLTTIDNSGNPTVNQSADINIGGTVKVDITNFTNVPDDSGYNGSNVDYLYFRSEKIDITPLNISHLDLRRYRFRYAGSVYIAGSQNITLSGGTIYGSTSLV